VCRIERDYPKGLVDAVTGASLAIAAAASSEARAPGTTRKRTIAPSGTTLKASPGGRAKAVPPRKHVAEFPFPKVSRAFPCACRPGGLRELHWHALGRRMGYVLERGAAA